MGFAHCIVPQEELPQSAALFVAPGISLLPDILKPANLPTAILQPSPSIVQVMMPATIIMQPQAETEILQQQQLPNEPQIETGVIYSSSESGNVKSNIINLLTPSLSTIAPKYIPSESDHQQFGIESIILPTIHSNIASIDSIDEKEKLQTLSTTQATTSTTLPSMTMQLSQSDTDNSVYEKLSKIPQVIVTNSNRNQQFLEMAEDPPEMIPHRDPSNMTN